MKEWIKKAMETERKETIEDVLGEFGFRLVWSVRGDHWVDVTAYEITALSDKKAPLFNRKDWKSLPDPVEKIEEAESYLSGFVKWDGCCEFDLGNPHWCGASGIKKHCALLKHIYVRAPQLMGREPEEPWGE